MPAKPVFTKEGQRLKDQGKLDQLSRYRLKSGHYLDLQGVDTLTHKAGAILIGPNDLAEKFTDKFERLGPYEEGVTDPDVKVEQSDDGAPQPIVVDPPPSTDSAIPEDAELNKMTVKQLKELAEAEEIPLDDDLNKADIINELKEWRDG